MRIGARGVALLPREGENGISKGAALDALLVVFWKSDSEAVP
jgi:hypothetical protein